MGKNKAVCSVSGCAEPLYLGGLCEEHHLESVKTREKRETAINTLETATIDGRMPDNNALCDELLKTRKWWFRACDSMRNNIQDKVLLDEAKYAFEWCVAIAQIIIDEELLFRQEQPSNKMFHERKRVFWERFENLEAGLMSNGVARTK